MNNYFTEMCSGSEAGSYLRLIDLVYHSTLGLRVIKKKNSELYAGMRWNFGNPITKKIRVGGTIFDDLKPSFMPKIAYVPLI